VKCTSAPIFKAVERDLSIKKMDAPSNFLLYIDGLPGAGKSSLVRSLELSSDMALSDELIVIEEYICGPMLDIMTSDIARYGFAYQVLMLQRRIHSLNLAAKSLGKGKSVVMDRSLVGDAAFAYNLTQQGIMTQQEWNVYLEMMNEAMELERRLANVHRCHYVYIDISTEEAKERIQARSRSQESSYTLSYLRGLETAHSELYNILRVTPVRLEWPDQTPSLHESGDEIYDCNNLWKTLSVRE